MIPALNRNCRSVDRDRSTERIWREDGFDACVWRTIAGSELHECALRRPKIMQAQYQTRAAAACLTKRFDPNVMTMAPTRKSVRKSVARVSKALVDGAVRSKPTEKPKRIIKAVTGHADTLTSYLQKIGQFPLLDAAEEAALASRVQKGDDEAREQLIRANLRLVVKIAGSYQGHGLPLLDLISEGNIGLMTAVDRFDPYRGARLSTYAGIWIKQTIRRAIGNYGRTIRLPVHVVEDVIRMRQISSRLEDTLGREPDDAELGAEMDLMPARVKRTRQAASRIASLDAPLEEDDEEGRCLGDVLTDERSCWTPAHEAERQARFEMLARLLKSLSSREQLVLRHRFGLKDGPECTLETIGKKLRLTRERIRQIERTALKKLRSRLKEHEAFEGVRPHNGALNGKHLL
jgi:RNA polymerase primary sigma factor